MQNIIRTIWKFKKKIVNKIFYSKSRRKTIVQREIDRMSNISDEFALYQGNPRKGRVIVSLTSYGKRIKTVHYSINCLMHQSVLPDYIVLYLSNEEQNNQLTKELTTLVKKGLIIRYVKDIKAHTKYYYAMKEFPNDIIITIDDDIIYDADLIEELIVSYQKKKFAVHAMRGHRMLVKSGLLQRYNDWELESRYTRMPVMDLLPTGVGGVLYPPHLLPEETFDLDMIQKLSPYADDIWLKAMELLSEVPTVIASKKYRPIIEADGTQEKALNHINVNEALNDKQLEAVFNHYDLWKKLGAIGLN
ncbi:hypothetical protein [Sporolactobacillus terrae]|uniref:hypothetical protein n=1 Tax=Sporolactobacillus terrae TaxID=269673 RepID=UPI001CBBDDC3|nr:hypothetical protein [Sporolactobacillus terrae]UAK16379.1 hypothetical protein K7399_15750 [Sporolactobacillus terrae]